MHGGMKLWHFLIVTMIGNWHGPAEDYGGGDAVFLLPNSAKAIVRRTVWSLTPEEKADKREEIESLQKSNVNSDRGGGLGGRHHR
jgi:hypothetical protein